MKGIESNSLDQYDVAFFKEFTQFYASSRYGYIEDLLTVHSVLNIWYKHIAYCNYIAGMKLDELIVQDVAAIFYDPPLL